MRIIHTDKGIVFHPSVYVEELMDEYNISNNKLAKVLNLTNKEVVKFLDGDLDIDYDIATRLEEIFFISKQSWINLQSRFSKEREVAYSLSKNKHKKNKK